MTPQTTGPMMHADGSITLPPNPWVNDEGVPVSAAIWADYNWRGMADAEMPLFARRVLYLIADAVDSGVVS